MNWSLTRDNIQLSEPSLSPPHRSLASEPGHFGPKVREFLEASIAASTRRAYRSDLAHFLAWGGSVPASAETVASYLADHAATLSMATLARRTAAIGRAHILRGLANPATNDLVRIIRRGIRRTHGRPQERVAALTKEHLVAITSRLGHPPPPARLRAAVDVRRFLARASRV